MNRDEKLKKIIEEIKNDDENKKYTEQGIDPFFCTRKSKNCYCWTSTWLKSSGK